MLGEAVVATTLPLEIGTSTFLTTQRQTDGLIDGQTDRQTDRPLDNNTWTLTFALWTMDKLHVLKYVYIKKCHCVGVSMVTIYGNMFKEKSNDI